MKRQPPIVQFEDLKIDLARQRVWRGGRRVALPGLSFRLLEELLGGAPRAVSRRQLRRAVWGDIVVSDDTLRQRVRLLRQALGDSGYIVTVKGIGYRMAGPVRQADRSWRRPPRWAVAAAAVVAIASLVVLGTAWMPDLKHAILHALRH